MIKRAITFVLVLGLAFAWGSGTSFAKKKGYEGGAPGSGSISGTVSYSGPLKDIKINLAKAKNPEFCVTHPDADKATMTRVDHKITANGGKLMDAMVFIENIDKGKDWPKVTTQINFEKCAITPKMFPIRKTEKWMKKEKFVNTVIENKDPNILHNPHGYSIAGANRKTLFNKPLPSQGDKADVTKSFKRFKKKKDKHFFVQCDQHNFMESDGRIIWNPYFSITGADGSFKIDGIPDGKYKVTAWHPYAGSQTQEIEVKGSVTANFEVKK